MRILMLAAALAAAAVADARAETTPYQRIVVTRGPAGFQLFLNGNLQFHSADEYRYHEALVHPALALRPEPRRVLVLGGGDGLAVRELLKYSSIESITLVDIDPAMTRLARTNPALPPPSRTLRTSTLPTPRPRTGPDTRTSTPTTGRPPSVTISEAASPTINSFGAFSVMICAASAARRIPCTAPV